MNAITYINGMVRLQVNGWFKGMQPMDIMIRTIIYTMGVVYVRKLYRERREIPAIVTRWFIQVAKRLPGVGAKIEEENKKNLDAIVDGLRKPVAGYPSFLALSQGGMEAEKVVELMREMKQVELPSEEEARVSGTIYMSDNHIVDLISDVYRIFCMNNTLHPDVFPTTRKFEAEVVRMTLEMMRAGEEATGAMTSGGTESILMALKSYRDRRPDIRYPEIVAPLSAHVAFNKGCHYFGIKLVHADLDHNYKANIASMESKINSNTIALVGSAVSFPQGVCDDIPAINELAKKYKLPLHIDACLGGFVLAFARRLPVYQDRIPAFDFSLSNVTSMSCDMHKYGMTPKGTSCILFKNRDYARTMFFTSSSWPGGFYASPTIGGSKPGGLIASAWAVMVHMGLDGYMESTKQVMQAAEEIKDGLAAIPGIRVLVKDLVFPIVAFDATTFDIYCLLDALPHWSLNILQNPNCIHICVTPRHASSQAVGLFVKEVREAVEKIVADPSKFNKSAPFYGAATKIPDRGVVDDFLRDYVQGSLEP